MTLLSLAPLSSSLSSPSFIWEYIFVPEINKVSNKLGMSCAKLGKARASYPLNQASKYILLILLWLLD